MEFLFATLTQNRKIFHKILSRTPIEVLIDIPNGFRNNIWWNISHIVATQQILMYRWSGLPARVGEEWIDVYKKGTMPNTIPSKHQVSELSDLLIQTVTWAQEDYKEGLFKTYTKYTTSTKVTISSVEDAMAFNNFHEGYHLGSVVSLQKVLGVFPY